MDIIWDYGLKGLEGIVLSWRSADLGRGDTDSYWGSGCRNNCSACKANFVTKASNKEPSSQSSSNWCSKPAKEFNSRNSVSTHNYRELKTATAITIEIGATYSIIVIEFAASATAATTTYYRG